MDNEEDLVIEGEYLPVAYEGVPFERDVIVAFGDTLAGIHPNAVELGTRALRTIAQLAMATGANPLPGTNGIHAWRDKNGKLCIQFGVDYWRSQAQKAGGILWQATPRPMDDQERATYGVAADQIAGICAGALRRDVFGLIAEARDNGVELSIRDAKADLSRSGIGIAAATDYTKAGRPLQWTANLRAERDLLRQLVPTMAAYRQRPADAGWRVGDYVPALAVETLPADYDADAANRDLYADKHA